MHEYGLYGLAIATLLVLLVAAILVASVQNQNIKKHRRKYVVPAYVADENNGVPNILNLGNL